MVTDPQQQAMPPLPAFPEEFLTFIGEDGIWNAIDAWRSADTGRDSILASKVIDERIKSAMRAYAAEAVARERASLAPIHQAAIDAAVARTLIDAERRKPLPEEFDSMPEHWSVTVQVNAETHLAIGSDWVSGANDFDENVIIGAAKHLLSFIGYGLPDGGFTPPDDDASAPSREATVKQVLNVPSGWKLVPIEPTQAMCDSCTRVLESEDVPGAWAEMLRVAPASPSVAAEETGHGS